MEGPDSDDWFEIIAIIVLGMVVITFIVMN